ncbi:alpha/beta hydrolase [Corynebacterium sp. BF-R-2]|uniref:RBBP9/YdeN family alpha/beta hydrolase n=1 Tax=Corynebacterium sp. BF-R-2 TaxID=2943494 RepID=UPI00211DA66D|nr:alpha/beta hydrolase [Corynebacterium sp. BF-R-2]MCQ9677116.1 alpha/beta hydrolase [Corynebacterium sp. BF-R-2]
MHFYIVHGYQASPESHWFPWLEQQLSADGHTVHTIALPHSNAPELDEWVEAIGRVIARPSADTCFITHSLGGIALLHYLTALEGEWELPGLFIVSGFVEKLRVIPELDEFIGQAHVDLPRVKPHVAHTEVVVSTNDVLVDPALTQQLAGVLSAALITVENGGHFLERDGFTEFPQLYEHVAQWLRSL